MKQIKKISAAVLFSLGLLIANGAFAQSFTVTRTGPNGARYKLEQRGDMLPVFYVNNKPVARSQWKTYEPAIGRMMQALAKKQNPKNTKNPDEL